MSTVQNSLKELIFKSERKLHYVPVRHVLSPDEISLIPKDHPVFGFKADTYVFDETSETILVLGYQMKEKTNHLGRVEKTFRRIPMGVASKEEVRKEGNFLCTLADVPFVETEVYYNPLMEQVVVISTEVIIHQSKDAEDVMDDIIADSCVSMEEGVSDIDEYVSFPKDNKTVYTNILRTHLATKFVFYANSDQDDFSKHQKRLTFLQFDGRATFEIKVNVILGASRDGMIGYIHPITLIKWAIRACNEGLISEAKLREYKTINYDSVGLNNFVLISRFVYGSSGATSNNGAKGTVGVSSNTAIDTLDLLGYSSFVTELAINVQLPPETGLLYLKPGIESSLAPFGETVIPNLVGGSRLFKECALGLVSKVEKELLDAPKFDMNLVTKSTDELMELADIAKSTGEDTKLAKIVRFIAFLWYSRQAKSKTERIFKNLKVKVPGSRHAKLLVPVKGVTYTYDDVPEKHDAIWDHLNGPINIDQFGNDIINVVIDHKSFFVSEEQIDEAAYTLGGADMDGDSIETVFKKLHKTTNEGFAIHRGFSYRFPVGNAECREVNVLVMDKVEDIVYYDYLDLRYNPITDPSATGLCDVIDMMPPLRAEVLDIDEVLDFDPPQDLIGWFTVTLLAVQFAKLIIESSRKARRRLKFVDEDGVERTLSLREQDVMLEEINALTIWNLQTSDVVDAGRGGAMDSDDITNAIYQAQEIAIVSNKWVANRSKNWDEDLVLISVADPVSLDINSAYAEWHRVEADVFTKGLKGVKAVRSILHIEDGADLRKYPFAQYLTRMWGDLWRSLINMDSDEDDGYGSRISTAIHYVVKQEFVKAKNFDDNVAQGTAHGLLLNFLSKYGKPVLDEKGKKMKDDMGNIVRAKGAASILYSDEVLPVLVEVLKGLSEGNKSKPHGGLIATDSPDETSRNCEEQIMKYNEIRRLISKHDKAKSFWSGYRYSSDNNEVLFDLDEKGLSEAMDGKRLAIFSRNPELSSLLK